MTYVQSAVLENADLLREIAKYLEPTLPLILSFKSAREALRPKDTIEGQRWIISKKRYFATSMTMVEWAETIGCKFRIEYCGFTGSIEVLRWAYETLPAGFRQGKDKTFIYAAGKGHLEFMKCLISLLKPNINITYSDPDEDSLIVLKWLYSRNPYISMRMNILRLVLNTTIENGHLQILQWLHSFIPKEKLDFTFYVIPAAAEGHLHILQWFKNNNIVPRCTWDNEDIRNHTVRHGHLHILQWLYDENSTLFDDKKIDLCQVAVENGHLNVLKFLRSLHPPYPWCRAILLKECSVESSVGSSQEIREWVKMQEDSEFDIIR